MNYVCLKTRAWLVKSRDQTCIVLDEYFASTIAFISKIIDDAINHTTELRELAKRLAECADRKYL